MAKIYISSTYNDLKEYREAVYRTLRKMRHDVIAMEDYVATDQRPIDKCLNDVEGCELYVGIFAWRYGYVPQKDNPEGHSITELEYRKAEETGITQLIFVLNEQTPWLLGLSDSHTGEGENGKQINVLRKKLCEEETASFFRTPDELASLVSSSVANWEREQLPPQSSSAQPTDSDTATGLPQPREITRHALILYESIDQEFVFQLSDRLRPFGRSLLLSPRALFANEPEDFQDLDRAVCQCHTAVIIISDILLAHLAARPEQTTLILNILQARTGYVIALCRTANAIQCAQDWGILQTIDASGWAGLNTNSENDVVSKLELAIDTYCPERPGRTVGLPFVVVAMQQNEALELAHQGETLIKQRLGDDSAKQFQILRSALNLDLVTAANRYGATREAWKPFISKDHTVGELIENVVRELNDTYSSRLRGRVIKAQHYSFDALVHKEKSLHQLYRELAQFGCVILIDELSMFHPTVREAFNLSPLFRSSEQAAFVTISPFDADNLSPNQVLEGELRERLAGAFDRFIQDYDPQCEFGIGNEHRLKRWLHSSLPETLLLLRTPPPSHRALEEFTREVGKQPQHSFPGLMEGGAS